MANESSLVLVAPFMPDGKIASFNNCQLVPVSCEPEELQQAVGMISEQVNGQVLGALSKSTITGMMKIIEDFEGGR